MSLDAYAASFLSRIRSARESWEMKDDKRRRQLEMCGGAPPRLRADVPKPPLLRGGPRNAPMSCCAEIEIDCGRLSAVSLTISVTRVT